MQRGSAAGTCSSLISSNTCSIVNSRAFVPSFVSADQESAAMNAPESRTTWVTGVGPSCGAEAQVAEGAVGVVAVVGVTRGASTGVDFFGGATSGMGALAVLAAS